MHVRRLSLLVIVALLTTGYQAHDGDTPMVQRPTTRGEVPFTTRGIGGTATVQSPVHSGLDPGRGTGSSLRSTTGAVTGRHSAPHEMDIKMPGIRPTMEDQYICTSAPMPIGTQYITNFQALATMSRAHHLLVFGCNKPGSEGVWNCQGICQGESPKILYAWAKNAPPTKMPPDVGFQVGGDTGVKSLVLQIHYLKPVQQNEAADYSGVRLTITEERQKYIAGIFLLLSGNFDIPPHRKNVHVDVSCKYEGQTTLYPFGFRVHAHRLSTVISGYQYRRGNWSLLGKGNPQWPQAFYPMSGKHEIMPGDQLFARCTYDSSNSDRRTRVGASHTDEMCNFYMMYYTDAANGLSYFHCYDNQYGDLSANLPPGNDVPLPPNPALDEQARTFPAGNPGGSTDLADEPINYGRLRELLRDKLSGIAGVGGAPIDPHSRYLRLYDREEVPNRFDYYNDYLDPTNEADDVRLEPEGYNRATDPDYFYYEVQHQRSRNRNPKPYRDRGRTSMLPSSSSSSSSTNGEDDDRYRGDNIHGLDGAHAFFGFPDEGPRGDAAVYPAAGRAEWRLGAAQSQPPSPHSYAQEHSMMRLGLQNTNPRGPSYGTDPDVVRPDLVAADYRTGQPALARGRNRGPPSSRRQNQYAGGGGVGGGGSRGGSSSGGRGGAGGGGGGVQRVGGSSRGRGGGRGGSGVGTQEDPRANPPLTDGPAPTPTKAAASKTVITPVPLLANNEFSPLTYSASVEVVEGWPALAADDHITFGQVTGVGTDSHGNVHVFHRGARVWNQNSFDTWNKVTRQTNTPIAEKTVVTLNPHGKVIQQWGENMFYMPHGLHVDDKDNIWVTDVGLHQVFKFAHGSTVPSLTLGTKLEPGNDHQHFCKPTDVATLTSGEFFVSDGYCNSRIIKYSRDGKFLKQWGTRTRDVAADGFPPPGALDVPHSLTVLEKRGWVCVADRENGRLQCFTTEGAFVKQIHPKEFARRVFAVNYSPVTDMLYAVNGPGLYNNKVSVRGFSIDPDTGSLIESWGPKAGFKSPHDVVVSPQGDSIYVCELDPHRLWRLYIHKEVLEAKKQKKAGSLPAHPASIDGNGGKEDIDKTEADDNDLGASLVIGALLVVPVIFIVAVTAFMRLRKNGKFAFITTMMYRKSRNRRFNLGTLLSRQRRFSRLDTDDGSDHELAHLNSDSDVEEYSATTRKA